MKARVNDTQQAATLRAPKPYAHLTERLVTYLAQENKDHPITPSATQIAALEETVDSLSKQVKAGPTSVQLHSAEAMMWELADRLDAIFPKRREHTTTTESAELSTIAQLIITQATSKNPLPHTAKLLKHRLSKTADGNWIN